MSDFTAKDVQALRQATGAGMMDAKRALQENAGDAEAASRWLREQGLAKAGDRSGRTNTQGAVAVARREGVAAVVELRCETDYVAKSPAFKALLDDLAEAFVADGEEALARYADRIDELKVTLKENIDLGRSARFEAAEGAVLDGYLHVQNERGVNGVLVELVGGDVTLAHDVALHIASMRPQWLSRSDVPAERVAEEREVLETRTRNEGKPEAAMPKIVKGRLEGWYREHCLLEQAFVREPKQSIAQRLGDARLTRFAQVEIGR